MTASDTNQIFIKIFMLNRHDIMAFIVGMVRNQTAAEDIFQEVSLILWHKFDSYDETKSFKNWARGIASNKVLQYWQKQKQKHSPLHHAAEVMPAILAAYERSESNTKDMLDALQKCRKKVPEHHADLLKFRYEKKLPLARIADTFGKSLASTQKTLSRIRFTLQACINQEIKQAKDIL